MRNFEEMTWNTKVGKYLGEQRRPINLPYLEDGFATCEICQLLGQYTSAGILPLIPPYVVREAGVSPDEMFPYTVSLCHVCGLLHYSTFGYKNKNRAMQHLVQIQGFHYAEAKREIARRLQLIQNSLEQRREEAQQALDAMRECSTAYTLTLGATVELNMSGTLVYLRQKDRYTVEVKVYNSTSTGST